MYYSQAIALRDNSIQTPNVWNAFGFALVVHIGMFVWNPILLPGGATNHPDILMQVEFRDKLPEMPKPPQVVKKIERKQVVHKAHKSGISLSSRAHMATIHARNPRKITRVVARPAPRSRPAPMKMPKFVPHASDEDALAMATPTTKLATTTTLRPASNPFPNAPVLKGKSRGVRAMDVHFKLSDRGGISGGGSPVVNIPIGEERGEIAAVASAPSLHNAPKGLRHTSGFYGNAPLGEGVGVLAGKNRSGYVANIQVGEPSTEQIIAAGNQHGNASAGHGFEIGGPVGDRKILRRKLPDYPAWAEEKGISAIVKIFFTVKADGSIRRSLRVVTSSGYAELDSLAKDAILDWKFSPTSANSSTDEAWGVITLRFTLA